MATFLLDLSRRLGKTKYLDLPMSHQDIADHLGLTIETISRTITELERLQLVARLSSNARIAELSVAVAHKKLRSFSLLDAADDARFDQVNTCPACRN